MKKMNSNEIRQTFLNFFVKKNHQIIESAPLIPRNDPSLLWINAGVTPLKKFFDGREVPANRRMVSVQKCLRTGDIESVGKTARHLTFFEMLGNFSIGDYFKEEALEYAFELLTSPEYFGFDKDKLYITIYPTDEVAYQKWLSLGISESHIIKLENNYWEIGEGPSGPDSEIFYDRGEKYDKRGVELIQNEIENDRYIEIWNNVFSQYNAKDGVDRKDYEELPSKNIDTGMGLERMCTIIQEVDTNYDTDLFVPIIKKIEEISNKKYNGEMPFKVIADHIRTLTFCISDGATFENYGRGYVLRRLLRRSVRYGMKLGINEPFLDRIVDTVIILMKDAYPDLVGNVNHIKKLINEEEKLFSKTILEGIKRLEELFKTSSNNIISGSDAFKLYDTYGFPVELTIESAEEKGFSVDLEGFKSYMNAQKENARKGRKQENSMNMQNEALINFKEESSFVGYEKLGLETEVIAIFKDDELVEKLDDEGYIILKECPFYAESGGQIADSGYIKNDNVKIEVLDVKKAPNKQHLIKVKVLSGSLKTNDKVLTHVLEEKREAIEKNHSTAHLLQKSLQELLGENVHQAGSFVSDKSFRYDFTYHGRFSDELLLKIEELVNEKINTNKDVAVEYMTIEEAKKKGAMALFEDKYDNIVRVLTIADSVELCGGTHVKNTSQIKRFALMSLENKGADTYRIEGTTDTNIERMLYETAKPYNDEKMKLLLKTKKILESAKELTINLEFDYEMDTEELHSYKDILKEKAELDNLKEKVRELELQFNSLKRQKLLENIADYLKEKEVINNINVVITKTNSLDSDLVKTLVSNILNKLVTGFVLIANINNNSINFVAKSNIDNIDCGKIVKELSISSKGNGGGSKTFAQGGGTDSSNIDNILNDLKNNFI